MTVRYKRNRGYWKALAISLRLVAGTAVCLLVSLAVNFGLMFVDGLTPFGRSVIAALSLPLLIGIPLLVAIDILAGRVRQYRSALNNVVTYDGVTACFKANIFSTVIDRRAARTSSESHSGAFLIIRAGRLQAINFQHGTEWGDEALRVIAERIRWCIRRSDIVGRISESELAVFLPGATEEIAREVGERIRMEVGKAYFAPEGETALLDVKVAGVVFEHALRFGEICCVAQDQLSRIDEADELKLVRMDHSENIQQMH